MSKELKRLMMVHVKQYNQVCSLVYEKYIDQLKVRIYKHEENEKIILF